MSIVVKNLSFTYMKKTPYEKKALDDVSLTIYDNEILGIIGSTGSGKSTFIQHLNGLIKLQEGSIEAYGVDFTAKKPDFKLLRSKIGMVFQYPEYQLFEATVEKDVAYGPRNLGIEGEELDFRVKSAIESVGLDYLDVKDRSPFELSGGQKRRVAIAGIIAMRPEVLIMDEPTAGLDPEGKREILELIKTLKKDIVKTVVIVSHDMDEIARYADRIAVFHDSKLICASKTRDLFNNRQDLEDFGLDVPVVVKLKRALALRGVFIPDDVLTTEEFVASVKQLVGRRHE